MKLTNKQTAMSTIILDPDVEVAMDDKGRVVLIPDDRRKPVRLPGSDLALVELIQAGIDRQALADVDEATKQKLLRLIHDLEKFELLKGTRRSSNKGYHPFPELASYVDQLAKVCVFPFTALIPSAWLGGLMWLILTSVIGANLVLMVVSEGQLFAGAFSQYWYIALLLHLACFAVIHEFCHALVARLFDFSVSKVGYEYLGFVSFRPFTEIKTLMLSSDPQAHFWIPMAGVIGNMSLALAAGLLAYFAQSGSLGQGVWGLLAVFAYWRVLVDAGFRSITDASKALTAVKGLLNDSTVRNHVYMVRGIYLVYLVSFCLTIMLSLRFYWLNRG
jgi:hypothetical protein